MVTVHTVASSESSGYTLTATGKTVTGKPAFKTKKNNGITLFHQ